MSDLDKSQQETLTAFKNRAILYRLFYEEFSQEFGEEKTAELMKKAIYKWGGLKSERFKELAAKKDFKGVAEEFIKGSPCNGGLFNPSIHKVEDNSTIIDMARCPLVEGWKEMGLSAQEIVKMCDIANATDYGKYEGMGFKLTIASTVANEEPTCRLVIEEK